MNSVSYIAVIAVSAVVLILAVGVVVVAVGAGVYLFINSSSEPESEAFPPPSERREARPDSPLSGRETVSVRLSVGESWTLEHDSGARMEVPRGALTETVAVSISEVEPPASPTRTGRVYDFSVGDSPILVPITFHIPYELEPGADSSRIVPLHWDEELEVWMVLEVGGGGVQPDGCCDGARPEQVHHGNGRGTHRIPDVDYRAGSGAQDSGCRST